MNYSYIVDIVDLYKNFGNVELLKSVNFKVKSSEVVCVSDLQEVGKALFTGV